MNHVTKDILYIGDGSGIDEKRIVLVYFRLEGQDASAGEQPDLETGSGFPAGIVHHAEGGCFHGQGVSALPPLERGEVRTVLPGKERTAYTTTHDFSR